MLCQQVVGQFTQRFDVPGLIAGFFRDTKVGHLGSAVPGDQYVFCLQVAVRDTRFMGGGEARCDLTENTQPVGELKLVFPLVDEQIAPIDVFHDQPR